MINFLEGKVEYLSLNNIVINVNGVGYDVVINNPSDYKLNEIVRIYTYHYVRENEVALFGFTLLEEKEIFLKLISVKGIGPKTAINVLSKTNSSSLIQAIETTNVGYLKKLPGIGPKAAQQIILDLKGKLKMDEQIIPENKEVFTEARAALRALGFRVNEIDKALGTIDPNNMNTNDVVFKALQYLNSK